jgi:hypothetical protein
MVLKLRINVLKLQIEVSKLRIEDSRLRIANLRLRIADLKLRIDDLKLRSDVLKLRIDDLKLRIMDLKLPSGVSKLQIDDLERRSVDVSRYIIATYAQTAEMGGRFATTGTMVEVPFRQTVAVDEHGDRPVARDRVQRELTERLEPAGEGSVMPEAGWSIRACPLMIGRTLRSDEVGDETPWGSSVPPRSRCRRRCAGRRACRWARPASN